MTVACLIDASYELEEKDKVIIKYVSMPEISQMCTDKIKGMSCRAAFDLFWRNPMIALKKTNAQ